ncbi:GDP-L-fucose synthase family protein [Candidatus Contubernalis alkaliaceticus]|uniref:GDP-L-fucose synthase family protein n=1 Tax=Candidatus Contubernalis alkaliaceticus TaxID=338645 RepID=UPI001F4BF4ED|nr:GDP-L-fucose synthase [Candidatus Contubernalis alkalaceticus]UNC93631.1 GDP-L-fucose synthase [Candidatus Contubernalis alkalaceticus]
MQPTSKIYVAGHTGLVGSNILRRLKGEGFNNLVTRTSKELDLKNQQAVEDFFKAEQPEYVFMAAARVGGIMANSTFPAEFIYDNLSVQINVIHQSYVNGVKKLLFLGSSCIYPKFAPQPMKEEYLLSGPLEPTNEPYAVAKIAGIIMCQSYNRQYSTNFISVMPTNLYGPGDNFDLETSHVLPALIRKFHEAKVNGELSVTVWGTGIPRREFLHVEDLAQACTFLMSDYDENEIVNVGVGSDISILELAHMIKEIVEYDGEIIFDDTKPDGMARKLLDVSRINQMGWNPVYSLYDGIKSTYKWYVEKYGK